MNKLLIQKTDKENMFDVLINFHNQIKNALEVSGKVDLSKFNIFGLENIIIQVSVAPLSEVIWLEAIQITK